MSKGTGITSHIVPWALPFSLIAGIVGVVVLREMGVLSSELGPLAFVDLAFVGLYLVWILLELGISRRDASEGTVSSDHHSRELYAVSQALTILSALWLGPSHPGVAPDALVAIAIFIAGLAFRLWAIRTLGRFYSHVVRTTTSHRIVDTGPYRFVRHPAYTGMLLAHVGVTLAYFNFVTALVLCGGLLPAILRRIRFEERALARVEGYDAFCARRARLLPLVW
jgi:protein-S-isoprenylcysteine O-methyltransferase Ste14